MSLITECRELSTLRKNQQIMSFFLLFVNALLVATSTTFYIDIFTSDGLILKNYATSLLGLLILMPFLGRFAMNNPILTFRIAIILEFLSCIGYIMVSQSMYESFMLLTASFLIFSSNLLMRPILTQVDSIVTDGCKDYSLLKSKLDGIYTAIGAGIGAAFILLSIPMVYAVVLYIASLALARLYRNRVLIEVYSDDDDAEINKSAVSPIA